MKVCFFYLLTLNYNLNIFSDEIIIELPNDIWLPMVNLHNRILTAIPKKRRGYWNENVDEFYSFYFKNKKQK
jgi:hypothetical protein